MPPQITNTQLEEFRQRGIIRLRGMLPAAKVDRARAATRCRMREAGIWQDESWHVSHLRNAPINEGAKYARKLKGCREFDGLVDGQVPNVVRKLLDGQSTFCGMDVPQPLFTLPNADSWEVPYANWHLDIPRLPNVGIPGVQMFTFLETVGACGGGTLVVAGSHRLHNGNERISSKDLKRKLKKADYFRGLMSDSQDDRSRFLNKTDFCGDVELQVVEMVGEPGDVYFTDLRVLHTVSPNATGIPRIMLTRRYFLSALRDMIYNKSDDRNSGMS